MNKYRFEHFLNTSLAEHGETKIQVISCEQETTGCRATSSKLGRDGLIHSTDPYWSPLCTRNGASVEDSQTYSSCSLSLYCRWVKSLYRAEIDTRKTAAGWKTWREGAMERKRGGGNQGSFWRETGLPMDALLWSPWGEWRKWHSAELQAHLTYNLQNRTGFPGQVSSTCHLQHSHCQLHSSPSPRQNSSAFVSLAHTQYPAQWSILPALLYRYTQNRTGTHSFHPHEANHSPSHHSSSLLPGFPVPPLPVAVYFLHISQTEPFSTNNVTSSLLYSKLPNLFLSHYE